MSHILKGSVMELMENSCYNRGGGNVISHSGLVVNITVIDFGLGLPVDHNCCSAQLILQLFHRSFICDIGH